MATSFVDPTTGQTLILEPEPEIEAPPTSTTVTAIPEAPQCRTRKPVYDSPDDIQLLPTLPPRPNTSRAPSPNPNRDCLPEVVTAEDRRRAERDLVSTNKVAITPSPTIVSVSASSSNDTEITPPSPVSATESNRDSETATVTPLHLLGGQSDMIDCPFCQRRTETRVKRRPSFVTHATATTLFFTTIVGGAVPYAAHWNSNISHYCTNCDHEVAQKRFYSSKMKSLDSTVDSELPPPLPPRPSSTN